MSRLGVVVAIVLGSGASKTLRSDDDGATFTEIVLPRFSEIGSYVQTGTTIWTTRIAAILPMARFDPDSGVALHRSVDGLTWTRLGPLELNDDARVAPDSKLYRRRLEGEPSALLIETSTDGIAWNRVFSPTESQRGDFAILPLGASGAVVAVARHIMGDERFDVFVSTDGGATFPAFNDGLPGPPGRFSLVGLALTK